MAKRHNLKVKHSGETKLKPRALCGLGALRRGLHRGPRGTLHTTALSSRLHLLGHDAGVFTRALVNLDLAPGGLGFGLHALGRGAQLGDGLVEQQLLESPLLDVGLFVVFELADVLHRARKDGALVLLAVWYNLSELIDAFIDGFSAPPFNCVLPLDVLSRKSFKEGAAEPSLWLSRRILCHSSDPTGGRYPAILRAVSGLSIGASGA